LIELLVVVAIISLLLSILLPSLGAARRQAKTTVCASNLRQIGIGWTMYAGSHSDTAIAGRPDTLPGDNLYWVGNGQKYRPRWLASLGAAVEIYAFDEPEVTSAHQNIDNRLLICTEAGDRKSERNASYGYNFQFLGNARTRADGSFVNFPVKIDHIRGADTVVAADSLGTAAEFPISQRAGYRADGSGEISAIGNHAYMLDPPRLTAESDRCDGGVRAGPDARHQGRAVFVFADGHAVAWESDKAGYVQNEDGSFAIDDPQSTNRYFSGSARDDDPPAR
jgi:prepilin-type processing-associated H-X9-DG protein